MSLQRSRRPPIETHFVRDAWNFVRRVTMRASNNDLTGYSAQIAYYVFLSLFPSLLFLTSLLAFLPIHHRTHMILGVLGHTLPKDALALVKGNFGDILHHHRRGLLSFSAAFAIYSASNAISAIGTGLNRAHGVAEDRPYWRILLMHVLLVLGLALALTIALAIFFFGPVWANLAAKLFGLQLLPIAFIIIRWPILLLATILATAMLYHFTPNVRQNWRWLTPGSVFAIAGWIATSSLFAFYVNNFGSYNKTYGSIGAVIVLLTWMYLGGLIFLIGGQINSVIKRTKEGVGGRT
ncbi:MAG: YihY/virulence factor BrkB family protein [Acidiferrobacter sp.]